MHVLAIQCDDVVCHPHDTVRVRRSHILYILVNAFKMFFFFPDISNFAMFNNPNKFVINNILYSFKSFFFLVQVFSLPVFIATEQMTIPSPFALVDQS